MKCLDTSDLKVRVIVVRRGADDIVIVARSGACLCEY